MYLQRLTKISFGFAAWALSSESVSAQQGVRLLEPIGGVASIPTGGGPLQTFYTYFNLLWPWLIGTAAGVAVLMAVIAGLQIIMSGGDQGKRSEGVDRLRTAIIGLIVLVLAGMLLRTLNPSFYIQ
jgi:hypothetical protein